MNFGTPAAHTLHVAVVRASLQLRRCTEWLIEYTNISSISRHRDKAIAVICC